MLETRQARYFIAVAEELHFGRAARRLQMSQPPLSQAIKLLERQLGCVLLTRTQRSVSLTPAGQALLVACRLLVRQAEDAEAAARNAAAGQGGRLRVGAVASAFRWPLPAAITELRRRHPEVELRTREIDTREASGALLAGELDLAVVRQVSPVRGTAVTPLATDTFVLAVPTGHRLASSTDPVRLADLAAETWVWHEREVSPDYHDAMAALCRDAGFSPEAVHTARSVTSQLEMVGCGLGVSLVPASAASDRAARVVFRPTSDVSGAIELTIVHRSEVTGPAAVFAALLSGPGHSRSD